MQIGRRKVFGSGGPQRLNRINIELEVINRDQSIFAYFLSRNSFFLPIMLNILLKIMHVCMHIYLNCMYTSCRAIARLIMG